MFTGSSLFLLDQTSPTWCSPGVLDHNYNHSNQNRYPGWGWCSCCPKHLEGHMREQEAKPPCLKAQSQCGEMEIAYGGHRVRRCSTSETCYFYWIQRASFRTSVSWLHWPFPFPKAARVLKLIGGEDKSDEVSKEPPPIFLWGVHCLVPLFASDVDGIVVKQLFAPLKK